MTTPQSQPPSTSDAAPEVPPPQLSPDKMAVAEEVFKKCGEPDGLQMKIENIPKALRRFGLNPTAEQIEFIGKNVGLGGVIMLNEFVQAIFMATPQQQQQQDVNFYIDCFRTLDPVATSGAIRREVFVEMMMKLGEKFTQEQVDEMLKFAPVDGDGNVLYMDFATKLMAQ